MWAIVVGVLGALLAAELTVLFQSSSDIATARDILYAIVAVPFIMVAMPWFGHAKAWIQTHQKRLSWLWIVVAFAGYYFGNQLIDYRARLLQIILTPEMPDGRIGDDYNYTSCGPLPSTKSVFDKQTLSGKRYLRVTIKNDDIAVAKNVHAEITRVSFMQIDTRKLELSHLPEQAIPLVWAGSTGSEVTDIAAKMDVSPKIGIVFACEGKKELYIANLGTFQNQRSSLSEIGNYKADVRVFGDNMKTLVFHVIIRWNGKWEDLDGYIEN